MPTTSEVLARSGVVLIAEDNQESYEMIAEYLETMGFQVCRAKNGEEALTIARETRPDIILMDIQMPIMDGLTMIEELRKIPSQTGIPIIFLTTESDAALKTRAKNAGATGWLTKPFDPENLVKIVRKVLGK